jgi:cysteine-rich repeat protein
MQPGVAPLLVAFVGALLIPVSAAAQSVPADIYQIQRTVEITEEAEPGNTADTVDKVNKVLDEAGRILQGVDIDGSSTDVACPVRFTYDNLKRMSTEPRVGYDVAGLTPNTAYFVHGYFDADAHALDGTGIAKLQNRITVNVQTGFASGGSPGTYAHEIGHNSGLGHLSDDRTLMNSPGSKTRRVTQAQCDSFVKHARDSGLPTVQAECLLNDNGTIVPSPRWSLCNEAAGFCDGAGRCVSAAEACVDASGPPRRGANCSEAGLCGSCSGSSMQCVPCGSTVTVVSGKLGFFLISAMGGSSAQTLYRTNPTGSYDIELDWVLDIGRDARSLTRLPGTALLYTLGAVPSASDVLIELDTLSGTATEGAPVNRDGIIALSFGKSAAELYGLALIDPRDPNSPTTLVQIDPVTGNVTQVGHTGISFTSGLAYDSATGTLLVGTHRGGRIYEVAPSTGASLLRQSIDVGMQTLTHDGDSGLLYTWLGDFEMVGIDEEGIVSGTPALNPFLSYDSPSPILAPTGAAISSVCGDGVVDIPFEECDDGNFFDGDGCTNLCAIEAIAPGALDDPDGDGVPYYRDNCPAVANSRQVDTDYDRWGDRCDSCPIDANPDQADADQDGVDDVCDNSLLPNADQADSDGDGLGDVSDNCPDINTLDVTVTMLGPDQTDTDSDGEGDACDADYDGDGVPNRADNCPLDANSDQTDSEADGIGDRCDICVYDASNDVDGDGLCELDVSGNITDNCPYVFNKMQRDPDHDGIGSDCDNCMFVANPAFDLDAGNGPRVFSTDARGIVRRTTTGGQLDDDADGRGNACDRDYNNDGVATDSDYEAFINASQSNVLDDTCVLDLASGVLGSCAVFDADGVGKKINRHHDEVIKHSRSCDTCPLACEGFACDDDKANMPAGNDNRTAANIPD